MISISMQLLFKSTGISYRNSSLELREKLALGEDSCKQYLKLLNSTFGLGECMILSTCNRTEIYYSSDRDLTEEIVKLLAIHHGGFTAADLLPYFQSYDHRGAVEHLFEVSLGLDSKVLGDLQISNQVKKAYQWSADEGLAGPFLHRLMHSIFYASKRVAQETAFRDGAASVSYMATDLAKKFIPNFQEPKILVLGLGEIGQNIAENLSGLEAEITLCNRSIEKSKHHAERLGHKYADFESELELVNNYDVVISSVAVEKPILTSDHFPSGLKQKLLIDLSVPRSIASTVDDLHHVMLYNIDQIEAKTGEAELKREKAIPAVKKILEDALIEFREWSQEMEVSPTIQKLKNALEEIRQKEVSKYLKKASDEELKLLDTATKNIIQKVLRLPVLQLKAACKRGDADSLVETLNDLFNLEAEQQPE